MNDCEKLIRECSDILASGDGAGHALTAIATEYAELCRLANQRLDQCATMIAKGSEYQALQLSETEPNLLDLVGTLSFSGSAEWAKFCEQNQLVVPEKLDGKLARALNALYAKGISANHPLYKDYRAAVTGRNDAKALQIIKTVTRVNPSDSNAKGELQRLENKLFQVKLQELRAALQNADKKAVLRELANIEGLAPQSRLNDLPEYSQAVEVRRETLQRVAIENSGQLVIGLESLKAEDSWRGVGDTLARLEKIQREHGFSLSSEERVLCDEARKYHEQKHREASEATRFRETLDLLGGKLDQIERQLAAHSYPSLQARKDDYAALSKRWQEVERFGKPLAEELQTRVRRVVGNLRSEVERLEKQRKVTVVLSGGAGMALLCAAAWFTYHAFQANDFANQLSKLKQAKQVGAAEKLTAALEADHRSLTNSATLRGKIGEIEIWIQTEHKKREEVDRQMNELEGYAKTDFRDADPPSIHTSLEAAGSAVADLAEDLKSEPEARLAVVRNKFDEQLTSLQAGNQQTTEQLLKSTEAFAMENLTFEKSVSDLQAAIKQIEPNIGNLEKLCAPGIAALKPSDDVTSRLNALKQRVEICQKELAKIAGIQEAMQTATTLDAYQRALEGYRDSLFVQSETVRHARKLLAGFPTPDGVLMNLLMPGDSAAWATAKQDVNGTFVPSEVFPAELSKLLALRDDDNFRDIWQATLIDHEKGGASRTIYSRGEIKQEPDSVVNDQTNRTWSGNFYDPKQGGTPFIEKQDAPHLEIFGAGGRRFEELTDIRRSATTGSLEELNLAYLINEAGTQFQKPILRVIEDLVTQKDSNPLFRAYVMQQIRDFVNIRPNAWGVQWCPALRRDFAAFDKLCDDNRLRSSDWMTSRANSDWGTKFTVFFRSISGHSYLAEAHVLHELVTSVDRTGVGFAGYAGDDGKPVLLGEASASKQIWGIADDGIAIINISADSASSKSGKHIAPFSPLFYMPLDCQKLLADTCKRFNIAPNGPGLKDDLPPLFRSLK